MKILYSIIILTFAYCLLSAQTFDDKALYSELAGAKNKNKKVELYLKLADCYKSSNDYDKALDACEQALDLMPDKNKIYAVEIARGDINLLKHQYEATIVYYKEAVRIRPKSEEARLRLAQVYQDIELYQYAREQCLKVLKRDAGSFNANFRLASIYYKEGFNTQALDYYRRALALKPSAQVFRQTASCAQKLGNLELAIAMLKQAASIEDNYNDKINLGFLYELKNLQKEAEESYSDAIKINQDNPETYLYLGILYFKQKKYDKAESLLEIAREKAPRMATVHLFLSQVSYANNNIKEASREIALAESMTDNAVLKKYFGKYQEFMERH